MERITHTEGVSLEELQRTSFQRIRAAMGDSCQVVLIGEATHGTDEYYQIRADLTKALLLEDDYDAVICEGDFPPFFELNRFVGASPASRMLSPQGFQDKTPDQKEEKASHSVETTVDQAMAGFKDRFPEWMWLNNVMREFATWLRDFNRSRSLQESETPRLPVQLLGLDIYSLFRSVDEVIEYLVDAGETKMAEQTRRRYGTLDSFRPEPSAYGWAVDHDIVKSQAAKVANVLVSLYKNENRLYQIPGNGAELFNAIENARVVEAAEAYYRQMFVPGENTWNLRDSAFLDMIKDTISYIEQQKKERGDSSKARVIVWAHNSHIGHATTSRGQFNVGQLCRQVFGKNNVYNIGFSSYTGTVRAAQKWGGEHHVMKLNPAVEGSHEYLLHLLAQKRAQNAFGFTLRSNSPTLPDPSLLVDMEARALFDASRIERFVGVSYHPETELQSHYSTCNLAQQFDFILHVDHSNALRVDKAMGKSRAGKKGRGINRTNAVQDGLL